MRLLLTALALVFILPATAQRKKNFDNYYNRRVHVGLKGGANMVKLDGRGFDEGFRYGFHGGAFVQLKLVDRISLQGELLFSQIQADTAASLSEMVDFIRFSENWSKLKLNYLDIPLIVNIGLGQLRAIKLQGGVQYGLLLNKNQTLLQNGQNAFKSGQFSVLGGFMWQLPVINIGARYVVGLDNLNNVTNKTSWKSQTGQVYIGFTL
jgi:hypothetical protein